MDKKKVFITGGRGFIGFELIQRILKEDRLIIWAPSEQELNLMDYVKVGNMLQKFDPHFIIHLAAKTEVEKSFYEPIEFSEVNYCGTVNLIEKAKNLKNLELFIFSSTMETYGNVPKHLWKPFDENTPQLPNAPYAVAKLACEKYLMYACRAYGFPSTILRQANTYGRKDNDFFVVEQIITQMLKNPDEINLGYREPWRNFLYIDDLIDLYMLVLNNVDLARSEVFCAGIPNAIQISKLAKKIAGLIGWEGKINWGTKPARPGEIYYLNCTNKKAAAVLDWRPKYDLTEGLGKTIKHWKGKAFWKGILKK